MKHLWEIKHPYYMNEGNYYSGGCHLIYEILSDFLDEWDDADLDYNWVVRWDWIKNQDEINETDKLDTYIDGRLMIQIIGQRKSKLQSCEIGICEADEPKVREYLQKYASYMTRMWEGFDLSQEKL